MSTGKNNNMSVVHIGTGKDTLDVVPKAPVYLTDLAKVHYKKMGNLLATDGKIKSTYLNALEIYAEAMAQFQYAVSEIKRKNGIEMGTGYIQTFRTGASNISAELTLKNDAEDKLFKCFKLFGMDPKSEKELKGGNLDPNQTSLYEQLMNAKRAN